MYNSKNKYNSTINSIFFRSMSDSESENGTDDVEQARYQVCLDQVKEAFNQRYGDPTNPNFDFVAYRRRVANEQVVRPDDSWVNITDPNERKHAELVYRMVQQERHVEKVQKQVQSMQDQLDSVNDRLSRIERCVNNTQTYLEVLVRELREAQQQKLLMQANSRNVNVIE